MSSSPFLLQDNQKVPYQVIGVDAAGQPGASLPAGATIAVTSADSTVATVVPDATPAPGTLASGFIVPATPLKLNTPVQINVAITNSDGSAGATGSTQVSIVPGAEATVQVNLGTPVNQ